MYLARPALAHDRLKLMENGDIHLTRYSGVLASHHKFRKDIILRPGVKKGFHRDKDLSDEDKKKVKNSPWAKLQKRIFKIDVATCDQCGGEMIMLGALQSNESIRRYLRHIGLMEHPPPITPAHYDQPELEFEGNVFPTPDLPVIIVDS